MEGSEFYSRYDDAMPPPRRGSETIRPIVTNGEPHDSFYRAKLRDGFVDLRNSYSQRMQTRRDTPSRDSSRPPTQVVPPYTPSHAAGRAGGPRAQNERPISTHGPPQGHSGESMEGGTPRRAVSQYVGGLYRSSSDLHIAAGPPTEPAPFGSQEVLEPLPGYPTSSDSEFFAMLQSYNSSPDQRAPPTPGVQQVFRGGASKQATNYKPEYSTHETQGPPPPYSANAPPPPLPHSHHFTSTTYGATVIENRLHADPGGPPGSQPRGHSGPPLRSSSGNHAPESLYGTPSHTSDLNKRSPKLSKKQPRPRSGDVSVLLRKLKTSSRQDSAEESVHRGSVDAASHDAQISGLLSEILPEERLRHKAFIHYDCQSIGLNFVASAQRRQSMQTGNMKTGASAASQLDELDPEPLPLEPQHHSHLIRVCPGFTLEVGGEEERCVALTRLTAQRKVQQLLGAELHTLSSTRITLPLCNGVSVLDPSTAEPNGRNAGESGERLSVIDRHHGYVIEYSDKGCTYYRHFFRHAEHQNYFGIDENLGPLALSIKREKVKTEGNNSSDKHSYHQYRVIIRNQELSVLRGVVMEDSIPASSRLSNSSSRGLSAKEIIEYVAPEIQISCLKQAVNDEKTKEALIQLDEQRREDNYKVGVMYCRAGQSTEEDMYNNEHGSTAFTRFLELLSRRVQLKGFDGFKGGLDNKTDTTGTHSYHTKVHQSEIMFHISTLLPYTDNNIQQLMRKRHIGNDIVTIIFQEPGSHQFNVMSVRSQFQHVFIIVQVNSPGTEHTSYTVAVTRSRDVPPFGPPLPDNGTFPHSQDFADYLMTKIVNAESATQRCPKFEAMAVRTRREYIKELAQNSVTSNSLDNTSKLGKFALSVGSGKKKDKKPAKISPERNISGALVWPVQIEDFSQSTLIDTYLAISKELLVVIEMGTSDVLFCTWCSSVIGWTRGQSNDSYSGGLRIYYDKGDCVVVKAIDGDDLSEIVERLENATNGCQTDEIILRRNEYGQLGFHVHLEGLVSDIEPGGRAWEAGLRTGSRLVEICKVATATLTHEHMIDLLRTSVTVNVVVIAPVEEGKPRRALEERGNDYNPIYPPDIHVKHHRDPSLIDYSAVENGTVVSSARKVFTGTMKSTHSGSSGSSNSPASTLSARNCRGFTSGSAERPKLRRDDSSLHPRSKSQDHSNSHDNQYRDPNKVGIPREQESLYGGTTAIKASMEDSRRPPNLPPHNNSVKDWYRPISPASSKPGAHSAGGPSSDGLSTGGPTVPYTPRQQVYMKRYRSQEVLSRKHSTPLHSTPGQHGNPRNADLRSVQERADDSTPIYSKIKRTFSDESLHSNRIDLSSFDHNRRGSQEIALIRPTPSSVGSNRSFTGAIPSSAIAGRSAAGPSAGASLSDEDLDWSQLVNTATKAIERTDDTPRRSESNQLPKSTISFNSSTDKEHSTLSGTSTPTPGAERNTPEYQTTTRPSGGINERTPAGVDQLTRRGGEVEARCRKLEADLVLEKMKYQELSKRYRSDASRYEEQIKSLETKLRAETRRADEVTEKHKSLQNNYSNIREAKT